MNSTSLSLPMPTAGLKGKRPFYFAVIDGVNRICFVNSRFFTNRRREEKPTKQAMAPAIPDETDSYLFDHVLMARMQKEKAPIVEVRMRQKGDKWVKWDLCCLEAAGEMLGKRLASQKEDWMHERLRDATIQAQSEERNRIAHELHDNVNQMLGSVQLYLSCLDKNNPDFEFVKNRVAEITALAIEEVRCLSHNMVSPDLEEKGLIESIQQLVEDIRYTRRFEIGFLYTDILTIETQDTQLKLTLFRIIQEQVRNICKYSKATHIQIRLQGAGEQIRLEIHDNGVGFDPKTIRRGIGLSHICERVGLYKGRTELNAAPGKGCELKVVIPVTAKRL